MRILFLGEQDSGATSFHRQKALERLGHSVEGLNIRQLLSTLSHRVTGRLHYRTGYRFVQPAVIKQLKARVKRDYDLIWVNGGELFGPETIVELRRKTERLVLYNNDDVTGKRDGRRFDMVCKSIPLYDLCCVVRDQNIEEYYSLGALNVLRLMMSYDEKAHQPFADAVDIPERYRSEVAFIGTWIRGEHRDKFLADLTKRGVPISIWGARWDRSPAWKELKRCYRSGNLTGRDYVAAIQGAKLCLGLLSIGNRDLYTTRSIEVPFAGGLLCAERTAVHSEMYQEDKEAVFWSDVNECASLCDQLLADDQRRSQIRLAGMKRVRELSVGNEDICAQVLDAVHRL